jgi:hypothetical protein
MEAQQITEIQKLLKSVGIETFVNYYHEFEKKQSFAELSIIFNEKENWTINSKKTKVSTGKILFKKELNVLALYYIINVVKKRLSNETIERAKIILDNIKSTNISNNEYKDVELMTEEDIY